MFINIPVMIGSAASGGRFSRLVKGLSKKSS